MKKRNFFSKVSLKMFEIVLKMILLSSTFGLDCLFSGGIGAFENITIRQSELHIKLFRIFDKKQQTVKNNSFLRY